MIHEGLDETWGKGEGRASVFSASASGCVVVPFTKVAKAGGGESGQYANIEMSVRHLKGDVNSEMDIEILGSGKRAV